MDARTALSLERVAGRCQCVPAGTPASEVVTDLLCEARSLARGEACDPRRCEAVVTKLFVLGIGADSARDGCAPTAELDALIARIRADACA